MHHDMIFITSIEHFSYLAIFCFALFSGYFIPIPEEIILLITGYMAWARIIHLTPAIFVAILAFIIGDNILFKLTLKHNKHVEKLIHEVLSLKIVARHRPFLEKYLGMTIFVTRFFPFLRFVGPVFSGYVKADETKFMIFNTLAIIIYAPFVILVGFFCNQYFGQIIFEIAKVKHVIFVFIMIIIGLLISRTIDYYFNKIDSAKQ